MLGSDGHAGNGTAVMILMVEAGGLGNQMFQYVGLRSVTRPRENIVLFGFDSLFATFDGIQARRVSIENSPLRHLASLNYESVNRWTAMLPGLSTMGESAFGEPDRPSTRNSICAPAWFQNGSWACTHVPSEVTIKSVHRAAARSELTRRSFTPESTAFVHARGGDYRTWPSRESAAMLPASWYAEQVAEMRAREPDLEFVVVGDDPKLGSEIADVIGGDHIQTGSESIDLAILASCQAGILSAGTFAFWGAHFAHASGSQGPFIAPEFWIGHRTQQWYPPFIEADFLDYR